MEEQHRQHARIAARDEGATGLNPDSLAMVSAGMSAAGDRPCSEENPTRLPLWRRKAKVEIGIAINKR